MQWHFAAENPPVIRPPVDVSWENAPGAFSGTLPESLVTALVSGNVRTAPSMKGAKGHSHFPSGINIHKTNREDVSSMIHPLCSFCGKRWDIQSLPLEGKVSA